MPLAAPVADPLGKVLDEIRDYWDAPGLGNRVRGGSAAKGDADYEVLENGTRRYKNPFCVLRRQPIDLPNGGTPTQTVRILFQAYGRTEQEAAQASGAVVAAVHDMGPREHPTAGYHIYRS